MAGMHQAPTLDKLAADAKKSPVELWKKEADKDVLDQIELDNKTEIELSIHDSHYLKEVTLGDRQQHPWHLQRSFKEEDQL